MFLRRAPTHDLLICASDTHRENSSVDACARGDQMVADMTVTSQGTTLDPGAVQDFKMRVRGLVLQPEDMGYDEARTVQNGLIDRRPAIIVQCAGSADVVETVNFARSHSLLLSIRGGGHNVAGNAVNDGGLVIDLSSMRGVRVDPVKQTVRAQGGATWGDVDRETQLFGLATPGGLISTTGIAGLTIHGGLGWLRNKHGLSLDSLLSVDIVTADGQLLTASESENADLFWAVRGAGSNFGVITSFEFKSYPVGPMVAVAATMYAQEDAAKVLPVWREFMSSAPDEVSSVTLFWNVPEFEYFPPDLIGKPIVVVAAVYSGNAEEGARLLRPLREIATPVFDLSEIMPYTVLQSAFDAFFPQGLLCYWKSRFVDNLEADTIDMVIQIASNRPSPQSAVEVWHLGGAMNRVPVTETSFGRRDAPYLFSLATTWTDPAITDQCIAWTRETWKSTEQFSRGGLYLNFAGFGEEKTDLVRAGYGENYNRLVELKRKYDPTNLFRMNNNINPGA
jgi:FAD/FMN-containing dehydrogenase